MVNFNFVCEVFTALQAKIGHICRELFPWLQLEVRVDGKCYNVTCHFVMCMLKLNLDGQVVTALQAKTGTYMLGMELIAAMVSESWW